MKDLMKIISNFKDKRILVIGDIMLDEYIEGTVTRINPEAPIPIVKIQKKTKLLGGAGNVASNLSSLGAKTSIFSFVGSDKASDEIKKILQEKNISYFFGKRTKTIVKSRIIARSQQQSQQVVRLDIESEEDCIISEENKKKLEEELKKNDMIIISDYAKGTITKQLINIINNYKEKTIVDPKPKNKELYLKSGFYLIKPNEKESIEISNNSDIEKRALFLKKMFKSNILITRGEKGMYLLSDKILEIPTVAKEVYDGQGAGDTVIATIAISIVAGATLEQATILSNYAAAIVVKKRGTYSVGLNELKQKILKNESKLSSLNQLETICSKERKKGKKIVWTNGCFDILHIGHIRYLKEAKEKGDILIVGLDSDESIKKLKGNNRPINNQYNRAEILSSIEYIDYVILFEFGEVSSILNKLKPDIYVKGGDYNLDSINQEERKIIELYGGKIYFTKDIKNYSTTNIIRKIKEN